MNCDCIKDIEQKLVGLMKPRAGDDVKVEAASVVLMFGAGLTEALQIPFTVKGSKSGFKSAKGTHMGCNVSYCPFCQRPAGVGAYRVGEDAGLAPALIALKESDPVDE